MQIEIFDRTEFREWLGLNFDKEQKVKVVFIKNIQRNPLQVIENFLKKLFVLDGLTQQ